MSDIVFAIFAHPDDETLVAGTLMKKSSEGAEINLVVITNGEAGVNPMNEPDLGKARLEEWHHSAEIMGAKTTHSLGYGDSTLTPSVMSGIAEAVSQLILAHLATIPTPAALTLITFDQDGLTGHQDHRTVTGAVMEVFAQLPAHLPSIITLKELLCCRLSTAQATAGPSTPQYPLTGYTADEIDQKIDVSSFVARKKTIMNCHGSQASDMEKWKQLGDELLGIECFRIIPATGPES